MVEQLPPLQLEAWQGFLRAHYAIVRALDAVLIRRVGLSLSAFEVLRWLEREPETGLRMSDLADLVLLSRSGVTRLVDQLEARGLLRRVRCETDQRGYSAVITSDGCEALAAAADVHFREVQAIFTGRLDDDDLAALVRILGRVASQAEKAPDC
ncbi:MAG TPA: MarR family winged helix-turn-helix transcriptional regulator [Actinomycetota bacterium]|nr:MarR family winged helix-turn-helix transcriptional regulator [Actinomycetota bacterium]